MEQPDKKIIKFIEKHHVLTLATSIAEKVWCCNCFYAYDSEEQKFIFTSELHTRHIKEILQNPYVGGSIVLETKIIGKIQGVQFEGRVLKATNEAANRSKMKYLKRFPYAIVVDTPIWTIEIMHIKYTDNRLGFGKKLTWHKN